MPKDNALPAISYVEDQYYVTGHIPFEEFRQRLIDEDFHKDPPIESMKHEYWRVGRAEEEGEYAYYPTSKGRGAKPVTVLYC